MADLDDFFAKKDRKKSKTTKKFSTTDEVAKKLEDNAKKSEKLKKERVPEGDEGAVQPHEQDEWKDFEEEKKDYSGLKIGNLTLSSSPESVGGATDVCQEPAVSFDEACPDPDRKLGPWKRVDVEVLEEAVVIEKKPEPVVLKPVGGGTYVPPSLRNQSQQQPMQPSRLRSKAAPDIHNEEFFPTLSKTGDHKKNRSEGSFEVVQHSRAAAHRHQEQPKGQNQLPLENRYKSLDDS